LFDIFVSYASADRDRVALLAGALEDHGWSLWWDSQIPPGKTFDEVIEEALDGAKAVICVWTEAGTTSRWVRTEAAEGAERNILVPVLLEDVRIPLAFRRIQAADLSDWEPGTDHVGFSELIIALEALLDAGQAEEETPPLEREDPVEQAMAVAQARADKSDWEGVIAALGSLEAEAPKFGEDHADAAELLVLARRKREATELYRQAELLYAQGRWPDVVSRFDRILELDPDIEYGTDLRERALRAIDEDRRHRLSRKYERAVEALDAREWRVAVARFEELMAEAPEFRDTAEQLERASSGAIAEARYRDLQEMLEQRRWEEVVAGMQELETTAPEFGDPENLLVHAEARGAEADRRTDEMSRREAAHGPSDPATTREIDEEQGVAVTREADGAAMSREFAGSAEPGQAHAVSTEHRSLRVFLVFPIALVVVVALAWISGAIALNAGSTYGYGTTATETEPGTYFSGTEYETLPVAKAGLVAGGLWGLAFGLVLDWILRPRRHRADWKRSLLVVSGATLGGVVIGFAVFGLSEAIADENVGILVFFVTFALGLLSIGVLNWVNRVTLRHRST
jgi:tetratricopeptide (TPR) repeat protein